MFFYKRKYAYIRFFPHIVCFGFDFSFSSRCESVVAKLTLEITGIPQLSNGVVGWPSPTFTAPTRSHVFEVR